MKFQIQTQFDQQPEGLIIPLIQNQVKEDVMVKIGQLIGVDNKLLEQDFQADFNQVQILYPQGAGPLKKLFILGLGKDPGYSEFLFAFRAFGHHHHKKLPQTIGVDLLDSGLSPEVTSEMVEGISQGLLLAGYQTGLYKTDAKENSIQNDSQVSILLPETLTEKGNQAMKKGIAAAHTQLRILDLVNAAGNKVTPVVLSQWALESGKIFGYQVHVLDEQEILNKGLFALMAVSQGSTESPFFLVIEYKPAKLNKKLPTVGLVGKGVTFDTGGISIKGSDNMHYMKSDMGGAAAVLGTIELTARLKLPIHLIGIIPAAENSVSAQAVKPGDVISSYLGKSIEVINTDAEGRLVLADGLAYLNKNFQPDIMIDVATLTGSCVRALGDKAGGILSNSDELAEGLISAGEKSGERLWRFPLWDEYDKDLESGVADIRNISKKPVADVIYAAKFLEAFIEDHPRWAHLDIAGVAFGDSEFSKEKSATAFGVKLLTQYLHDLVEST
ncbi:MAG: leucyl aminopeptidase family protein [Bacteroidetes bacterium]|nr:leucyl aminopeptidase family protein [Bacteroidota bacterium]